LSLFQILYDALQSAEPISLELDRNLQVLLPSQAAKQVDLPPAFFNMTAEELKREQQMRFVSMFLQAVYGTAVWSCLLVL
jgi:UBX domain-containing protein 6